MNSLRIVLILALQALSRNIMRSVLTTLGIIIGVGAVIAMVEIGQGSKAAVEQTIKSMGSNNLLIQPGTASSGGVTFGSGSITTLVPGDAHAIARECRPAVDSCALVVRARTQVVYNNRNWVPLYIYGTQPSFLDVREWDLASGRMFTDQEVNAGADVCVVGQTIVRELFAGAPVLGAMVRINNSQMKVVGVLTRKGANMMGVDQDDIVLAPWRTIKLKVSGQSAQTGNQSLSSTTDPSAAITTNQRFPGGLAPTSMLFSQQSQSQLMDNPQPVLPPNIDQILVRVSAEPLIPGAIRQITALLNERHRIKSGQPSDFNIRDMTELSKAMGSTSQLMGALLLAVALISLVVGGVGIMNIMLVSVTERTREIGLRMAVGARPRDILRQFLAEAIVLCLMGGALGIGAGRGVSWLLHAFLRWPTVISYPAIIASVGVSATVGVLFGYYPAWKASRLDPIDALRYE
jgi:ABC-type antimicrobial peptide transport system permease subunit